MGAKMNGILAAVIVVGGMSSGQVFGAEKQLDPGPVLRGTINVVVANDRGIVVLTDSMLSTKVSDGHRGWKFRQLPDPAQKLFQIDDHTVCAFAGFASVKTPAVPDFLNNVTAIMARYEGYLGRSGSATIAEKLELLDAVFGHYLNGVANMRDIAGSENDYYLELLLAGYDPDGTPEVGSLILNMQPSATITGESIFLPATIEREVIPVVGNGFVVIHGKRELAMQILQRPAPWGSDSAIAAYARAKAHSQLLTIEQMKALAISLKKYTSKKDPSVGGPNQIALLMRRHVETVEQPTFSPISALGFKFELVEGLVFDNSNSPGTAPVGEAVHVGHTLFGLYFKNSFKKTKQHIGGAYFGGNTFANCELIYSGGSLQFSNSNRVYDSDLTLIGVNTDTPEVKHLLNDFSWRHIQHLTEAPPQTYPQPPF
jgi:20S proteasome alpha/beta subunit